MNKLNPPISKDWQKSIFWTLLLFTLAVTVVTLVGEAFKTRLIGYMRFADFIDLVLNTAIYLASLVLFVELFLQASASRLLRIVFLVLALLFMYGQAMHLGTNAVNTFATEIRKYQNLPQDMYALLYFLDETLSHLIIDISQFCLFGCLMILEARYLASKDTARSQGGALTAGVLFGIWEAIVYIEGQKLILVPFVLLGLGGLWIWLWQRSGVRLADYLKNGPVTAFFATMLPSVLCGLAIYLVSFGSFTEPSKLQISPANLVPLGIFLGLLAIAALFFRFRPRARPK
jgi:hypothetical protein